MGGKQRVFRLFLLSVVILLVSWLLVFMRQTAVYAQIPPPDRLASPVNIPKSNISTIKSLPQAIAASKSTSETILINEVDADTVFTDTAEFVELFNGGIGVTSLDGLVLVFYNGSNDKVYHAYDLDGQTTDTNGYFVLCGDNTQVITCTLDVSPNTNLLQNGTDAVALYLADSSDFPNGTDVTTINLLDAIVYDTNDDDDPGLLALLNPDQPQVNENSRGNSAGTDDHPGDSNQRCPNGSGGQRNTETYLQDHPTPGLKNDCEFDPTPAVSATLPISSATAVPLITTIAITFSEPVTATDAFSLDCTASGTHVLSSSDGLQTYILTPTTGLLHDETCTVIVEAAKVHDRDNDDPPDEMLADYRWTFSTLAGPDNPPEVVATIPLSSATAVPLNSTLTITFSEAVTITTSSLTLACADSGSHSVSVSGGPEAYEFDPVVPFAGGEICTVTVLAAGVSDHDSNDPPDTMESDYNWSFVTAVPPAVHMLINELDADQAGSDTAEFIELFDGGAGETILDGLLLVFYNGGSNDNLGAVDTAFDLTGFSTDEYGYFVAGNTAVPGVDLIFGNGDLQNGADAVALYLAAPGDLAIGDPVTTTNLLDAIVYDTNQADHPNLLTLLNPGQPQVNENSRGNSAGNDYHPGDSSQRCPNGSGGQRNTDTYLQDHPTPGALNDCLFDSAPAVSATLPVSSAAAVPLTTTITITFSELVTATDAFSLNCTAGGTQALSQSDGPQTYVLTPTTGLLHDETCVVTVDAAKVQDHDYDDPPDFMLADYSWAFDTLAGPDSAPEVLATIPVSGATAVPLTSPLTITFTEAVTVTSSSFGLACTTSGSHAVTVAGGPEAYLLDHTVPFAAGETCSVTVLAADVFDYDNNDPPDTMAVDYNWSFVTAVPPAAHMLINELDTDQAGSDTAEFVELFDGGVGNTLLDGLLLVFYNGGGNGGAGGVYAAFDLAGLATDANGYFVAGNTAVPGVDLVFSNGGLQNGADAVALYLADAGDFTNGTAVTTTNLLDAIVYDTNQADHPGLLTLLNPGQPQVNEDGRGFSEGHSNQRCPNGAGGQRNTAGYLQNGPTPKTANNCVIDLAPAVSSTLPADAAEDVLVDSIISITFSEDVSVAGSWFQIECGESLWQVVDTAVSGGPQTWFIDPHSDLPLNTACTVLVMAQQVSDTDDNDPPDMMSADFSWQFSTESLPPATHVLINELDADTPDNDTAEFIELFDGGAGNTNLGGLALVFFNGGNDLSYRAFDLDGQTTDTNGYFVVGNTAVPGVDITFPNNSLQNGADAVALFIGDADDFPSGTAITTVNLLDAIVYATDDPNDPELLTLLNPNQPQVNENSSGYKEAFSNQRCPNGQGGQRNTDGYLQNLPTPKTDNNCMVDVAPEVSNTSPVDQGVDVLLNATITIEFSEAVRVDEGWFEIVCSSSGVFDEGNTAVSGGPNSWILDPSGDFAFSESCTVTIFAEMVTDIDAADPPDGMLNDFEWSFTLLNPPPATQMLINEVDADTSGSDTAEFIELYDGGVGNTNLHGLVVVLFNGATDAAYRTFDLDGSMTGPDGYFVLGNTAVANVDLTIPNSSLQNGADAVALYVGDAEDFPTGTPITTTLLLDALVYDTDDDDDLELLTLLNPGQPQINEDSADNKDEHANQRCPNGAGGQLNTAGYLQNLPTPGLVNNCEVDLPPFVNSTEPVDGATGVFPDANLEVTFGEAVTLEPDWLMLSCSESGAITTITTGGPQTFTVVPATEFGSGEICMAEIGADKVTDQDGTADSMQADFSWQFTIGTPAFGVCGDAATPIYAIQGNGPNSPLVDSQGIIIEGIVVGAFNATEQLDGFFVQSALADQDDDPQTSEGVFVYAPGLETAALTSPSAEIANGDYVRVQGDVAEFEGLTQLQNVSEVVVCDTDVVVAATAISLPVDSLADWEQYEGMSVSISQTVTANDHDLLGQAGQVELAGNGRIFAPTQSLTPGDPAINQQNINMLARMILDDGSLAAPLFLPPFLGSANTLRLGDTLERLTGVLSYGAADYRLHPTQPISFTRVNGRRSEPPDVGGRLKIASFNLNNYFNGDGMGGGFVPEQGAASLAEFIRQRDKIIATLLALDADMIGLTAIENDGYGSLSAIQDLVDGLNSAVGDDAAYAFIDPDEPQLGAGETAVAIVYRPAAMEPLGPAVTLDTAPFALHNRPPLAQTFTETLTGETFTVVVNHFKARTDCPIDGEDSDQADGQGCWNAARTAAAQELNDWLATNPTGSVDSDMLIVGDLNTYAQEDPIRAFIENGYVNMIGAFLEPEDAYTLVVQGETGYTDYVLSKSHLAEQISGVGIWHINADEPQALDYRMSNQTGLYQPDQYRSSDHDPVLIGLDLTSITAEFSSNSPVTIGGTSIFSNESGGTDPLTYTWDFGDGTPLSNATNPQHTYAAVGTYTVSLAVTDVWGGTAVYSDIHTILPAMSYLPMVQFNYNGY